MPRQVGEIREGNIRPAARPGDFYNRPAVAPEGRLEKIAAAYNAIGVNLGGYLKAKADAQWESDLATGVELFKRASLSTGRSNLTEREVKQMLDEGKIEGFGRYTRGVKQGVIKGHYETAAGTLFRKVVSEFPTMTVTDENGNPIPLEQSDDHNKVSAAIRSKITGYMMERTGGDYDPRLYAEYIQPQENAIMQRFIQDQAGARAETLIREQKTILNDGLSQLFTKASENGVLLMAGAQGEETLANYMQAYIDERVAEGMTYENAIDATKTFFRNTMRQPGLDEDYIEALYNVAMKIPEFKDDVEFQQEMIQGYDDANRQAYFRQNAEQAKGQRDAEAAAYEFMESRMGERISVFDLRSTLGTIPWQYRANFIRTVNTIRSVAEAEIEMTQEMPEQEFRELLSDAFHAPNTAAFSEYVASLYFSGNLTQQQANTAFSFAGRKARLIKAEMEGGASASKAESKVSKGCQAIIEQLRERWPLISTYSSDAKAQLDAYNAKGAMELYETSVRLEAQGLPWDERQRLMNSAISAYIENNKNFTPLAMSDPYSSTTPYSERQIRQAKLSASSAVATITRQDGTSLSNAEKQGIEQYVVREDVKGLTEYLHELNPTLGDPEKSAQDIIATRKAYDQLKSAQEGGTAGAETSK